MPAQCYLIEQQVKFYFEAQDLRLECKGKKLPLDDKEAQVLRYLLEHQGADGIVSVQAILKANWPGKTDKQVLMKLLFQLRQKFRLFGFADDGFIANGPNYQITYQFELIDGYQQELDDMRLSKRRWRLLIFALAFIVVGLLILP
ncbi:MAG: DNA-binding winged helix-turn-helix (wHTH) protein [Phenylobacterium sp.]|jgi:DNA-binding winged helix-turn-helix (wHTH) protein